MVVNKPGWPLHLERVPNVFWNAFQNSSIDNIISLKTIKSLCYIDNLNISYI